MIGRLIAPHGSNPYADVQMGFVPPNALAWPNVASSHEATCTIAAVPYTRSWKVLGVDQRNGSATLRAGSAGGGRIGSQYFAIVKERDEGVDTPVLDAHPGDGNVWTIEVSKAFAERIQSEAKRLAQAFDPYSSLLAP